VTGIDSLNGFEQELEWTQQGEDVVIPNLRVSDYPYILKIGERRG
jgi:hypothetical protein